MRTGSGRTAFIVAVAIAAATAGAYPEGAPWGAANPDADESCASCHHDYDPQTASAALRIDGLPTAAIAGSSYALTIRLIDDTAKTAGFQLVATGDGDAGRLSSEDTTIETAGPAARSTQPAMSESGANWSLDWQAPMAAGTEITFLLAASSANDDQSPLGDRIHYRRWRVAVAADN